MKRPTFTSLEDTIKQVQRKYANRPSPLAALQNESGLIPVHVPQHIKPTQTIKDALLGSFKPANDSFKL